MSALVFARENKENNDNKEKDDDSQNNIQDQHDNPLPRKRGRPRKNQVIDVQPTQSSIKFKPVKDIENREIILRIPLFTQKKKTSSSDEIRNGFASETEKADLKDSMLDSEKNIVNHNTEDNNELTLTDNETESRGLSISDIDENSNNSSDNEIDFNELIDELRKKDKIIKQLKTEITELKSSVPNTYSIGKDVKLVPMNISFVDNKTGKSILCEKTDIACWWCTYQFDTLPCFIPERFVGNSDNKSENKFFVYGCFCSFDCATAYNISLGDYKVFDRNSLIKRLYQMITGKTDDIVIAAPREVLTKFGGHITIEEYRKGNSSISKEYRLLLPPMVNLLACIEEKTKDKFYDFTKKGSKNISDDKKNYTHQTNITNITNINNTSHAPNTVDEHTGSSNLHKKSNINMFDTTSSVNIMESIGIREVIKKKK